MAAVVEGPWFLGHEGVFVLEQWLGNVNGRMDCRCVDLGFDLVAGWGSNVSFGSREEKLGSVLVFHLVRDALRNRVGAPVLELEAKKIGMGQDCVERLVDRYAEVVGSTMIRHGERIKNIRWRVDVIISSSSAQRVLRPIVSIEWIKADGTIRRCECSIQQFQQIRYTVAKAMYRIDSIKSHPFYKPVG